MGERVSDLSAEALLAIPGIGKDLAARIRELSETGALTYHQELLEDYPATLLDLLTLQGLGPKTVALLFETRGIKTLANSRRALATDIWTVCEVSVPRSSTHTTGHRRTAASNRSTPDRRRTGRGHRGDLTPEGTIPQRPFSRRR